MSAIFDRDTVTMPVAVKTASMAKHFHHLHAHAPLLGLRSQSCSATQNNSKDQEQERGYPGPFLERTTYTNGRVCSGLRVWQKKPAYRSRGFRGISSTGKETPVCGIPRPLDRAGSFLPFSSHRKPSSHWYTIPDKGKG